MITYTFLTLTIYNYMEMAPSTYKSIQTILGHAHTRLHETQREAVEHFKGYTRTD